VLARAAGQSHGPNTGLISYLPRFFGTVVAELLFVFSYSPVQFVDKAIDRSVHVFFGIIGVNCAAIHLNSGLGFMTEFFNRQDTAYVRHQIKMPFDLFNLGLDITSKGFGYLDVMA
jgi:hypothetical protein